jgi:hypothetical protein
LKAVLIENYVVKCAWEQCFKILHKMHFYHVI